MVLDQLRGWATRDGVWNRVLAVLVNQDDNVARGGAQTQGVGVRGGGDNGSAGGRGRIGPCCRSTAQR